MEEKQLPGAADYTVFCTAAVSVPQLPFRRVVIEFVYRMDENVLVHFVRGREHAPVLQQKSFSLPFWLWQGGRRLCADLPIFAQLAFCGLMEKNCVGIWSNTVGNHRL